MASMGIYVFSRQVLLDMLEREPGHDFGRELIPRAHRAATTCRPYLFDGYWADVGTIESFYEANVMLGRPDAPFRFWDPLRRSTRTCGICPGRGCSTVTSATRSSRTAAISHRCAVDQSVVGLRSRVGDGTRIEHSVVLGADCYEDDAAGRPAPARHRPRRRAATARSSTRTPASATARAW